MAGNSNLHDSARNKQDEFYTQLSLIEKELKHYRSFFAGKTVLCNCDDPYESNFFKYFAMNFNTLGLKKLVTTCYATSPVVGDEFEYYVDNAGQLAFVPDTDTTPLVCSTRRPMQQLNVLLFQFKVNLDADRQSLTKQEKYPMKVQWIYISISNCTEIRWSVNRFPICSLFQMNSLN